jgi:hypothetical protein
MVFHGYGRSEAAMRRQLRSAWIFLLVTISQLALTATAVSPAEESRERRDVRESFKFDPDEGLVLVPVRIGDKTYRFAVDSGFTASVVDSSLKSHVGARLNPVSVKTASGRVSMELYHPPHARIGSLPFPAGPVVCHSLRVVRESTGCDLYGFLGADFLNDWIVAIDFDEGRIDILDPGTKPDPSWGRCVHFASKSNEVRYLPVIVGKGGETADFQFVTGCMVTGLLQEPLFSELVASRDMHVIGQSQVGTLSGKGVVRAGRLSSLSVAGFQHEYLRFTSCKNTNVLGLGYWHRYRVTIDFPAGRLFLAKGKRFAEPDRGSVCGIGLLFKKSSIAVNFVDKKSPAWTGGVRARDILVELCGRPVSEMKPVEIHRLLRAEGKRITMTLDRNGKKIEAAFTLREYD